MTDTIIIRHRGRMFAESAGTRQFLCSMSTKLVAQAGAPWEVAIPNLDLAEAVPRLCEGKCPICESTLKVIETGRYGCDNCDNVFVNTEGYRLPALLADEIIQGAIAGVALTEFTTINVPKTIPSPMATYAGTAVGICPRCYKELNQRGECGCGWTPQQIDKVWEQIIEIVSGMVPIASTTRYTLEFESGLQSCKLILQEHEDGYRYTGRLVNVTEDSIQEITGRPKAIINFLVEKVQPVRPVNHPSTTGSVNTPKQESGHRLSFRVNGRDKREGTSNINQFNYREGDIK